MCLGCFPHYSFNSLKNISPHQSNYKVGVRICFSIGWDLEVFCWPFVLNPLSSNNLMWKLSFFQCIHFYSCAKSHCLQLGKYISRISSVSNCSLHLWQFHSVLVMTDLYMSWNKVFWYLNSFCSKLLGNSGLFFFLLPYEFSGYFA